MGKNLGETQGSEWMFDPSTLREEFRSKKVLITGGLGFIGSNLALRLVNYGSDVTLYTRTTRKTRNIREIASKVSIVQEDITEHRSLIVPLSEADYVFHLAAQTSNIVSMEEPLMDLRINVEGTLLILELCRRKNPDASIVCVGTVTQAGKPVRIPVDESHPDRPLTLYDANKLLAENYLRIYHSAFGMRTVFLRLPTVFGERQEISGKRVGIVNSFIAKALQGNTIQIFGDGRFLRDFLYIENVIDALTLVATTKLAAGESFVVSSGRGIPFVEMVRTVISAIEKFTGRTAHYEHVPWPGDWKMVDVGSFVGTFEKLNRCTGWYPRISFDDGINRTVEFYSKRIHEYVSDR